MSIFSKNPEDEKYVSAMRRGTAIAIDAWIVLFIRIFAMQLMATLWMNQMLVDFLKEFNDTFGTETIKNTPEHLDFVWQHTGLIFSAVMFYSITIFVGAVYYAYLNSSMWQGTIGKRLTKIIMTKESGAKVSFGRALFHYFLSLLPFVYLIYLLSYQMMHELTFYQALTSSELNIFFGIIFVLWIQIHLFTKKRTTAYDMICNTVVVKGKTDFKWPWSKTNN